MREISAIARAVGWVAAGIMLAVAVSRAGTEVLRDSTETDFARTLIIAVMLSGALTLFLWAVGRAVSAGRELFDGDRQR